MKTIIKSIQFKLLTLFFVAISSIYAFAQDNGGTSTTNNESQVSVSHAESGNAVAPANNWYTAPWVWVVGGAVFILLLVALLRNGNSSSKSEAK